MTKPTFQAQDPGAIEFTLTATYTLTGWQEIREAVSQRRANTSYHYALTQLDTAIYAMTQQATEKFMPEDKSDDENTPERA